MLNTMLKIRVWVLLGTILVKESKRVSTAYDKAKIQIKKLINDLKGKENETCKC